MTDDLSYVNIYADTSAWILKRCATEIKNIYPEISINGKPRAINYSINYALYRDVPGIKIGFFTHLETQGQFRCRFIQTIQKYDYYVSMCHNTTGKLISFNADREKITEIHCGYDERVKKKPIFGIVGRVYPSGRKGEYLVENMVNTGYKIKAWGRGWPITDMNDNWDELPGFYQSIDYLVVTSLNEGGPIPVLDALAAGVPVIAPDVGWCWEFPVIRYNTGNWDSLNNILSKLDNPPAWDRWSYAHGKMFKEIALKEGVI